MSATEESLGAILSDSEPATDVNPAGPAEAATSAAKEPEKPAEKPIDKPAETPQAQDESGKSTKAEKPEDKPESKRADVAAIIDERRKRQDAERRLQEVLSQQPPQQKPSVFDDEDKAISTRVDEGTRGLRETLYKQSVKIARLTYQDTYSSAEQAFMEAAERDERLIDGLRASDDPGEYIYTIGLQIRELADVGGDLMRYREKVTGELSGQLTERDTRIKALEAEVESLKKAQTDLEAIPRSLNGTSSGPAPTAADLEDEPLSKIARLGNH